MAKRLRALAVAFVLVAAGCSGSAEVAIADETPAEGPTTEASERTTVEVVEPTAEPAPTEAPGQPSPGSEQGSSPDPDAPVSADDGEVVISPEAPLPARRLCTFDVEETEELNLRATPSLDAPIVFGIPGGSCRMSALGDPEGGWQRVAYETQTISLVGYVSTEFADEDPVRTIALNWFDRVVAEQDTSDLAVQELVDDSAAIYPFPPAAFRAVSFDFGSPIDCQPLGGAPGISGCPVQVLDSAGSRITPMVIQTQLIAVRGGEPQVKVTGFVSCIGTEDCPNFDFLSPRIAVGSSVILETVAIDTQAVAIGTEAEEAIEGLKNAFGDPTDDTGWIVGCPLDSESELNERYVSWGSLIAGFRQGDLDREGPYFQYWSYELDENRMAEPDGPQPWQLELPDGAAIGMNITVAADSADGDLLFNEVIQQQQLQSDAWNFYGQGPETDTRINAIGVPFIPLCD